MIEVRHPRFDWATTPINWIPNDRATSKIIDVLHLLLPAGERWMARVMNQAAPLIEDPVIRGEVEAFLRQEAWHGRSHQQVVDRWKTLGLDTAPYAGQIDWLFDQVLADKPFGKTLPKRLHKKWLAWRVALIAAIEHYTSVLAEFATDPAFLAGAGADPTMLDLIRWHAAEELEHGHVAHEASAELGVGGTARRVLFALLTAVIWYEWIRGARFLAKADPEGGFRLTWKQFFAAGDRGWLPRLRSALGWSVSYYKPFYDPRKEIPSNRVAAVLARSPAVAAARVAAGPPKLKLAKA